MNILHYFLEHSRYMNLLGIPVIIALATIASTKIKAINARLVATALGLQIFLAILVLKTTIGRFIVAKLAGGIAKLYGFSDQGAQFVFGDLANSSGPWGMIFAVKVLPIIIFFGAFMSLLFHLGIVTRIVSWVSKIFRPLLGTSGAETSCAIANSFLGQTEAPLLIKKYLPNMTKSEIMVVMVSGMGTISGAIMALFAAMGVPATHMLAASVMAIPATIAMAKILVPETEKSKSSGEVILDRGKGNVLDAISEGTSDGLKLALNVGAMLIAFLALLGMLNFTLLHTGEGLNYLFSYFGSDLRLPSLSLGYLFSLLFSPFGYLLGLRGESALTAGKLIGTKVAVNELIAYGELIKSGLSERTTDILTYALCGFSNFSCIGIQVGGIGPLMPEKRKWLSELGFRAVYGATLANLLSALIAGLII